MTKVFQFIRTSPDTKNDGEYQELCIRAARLHLEDNKIVPPLQREDIITRKAIDVSRYDLLSSPIVINLWKELNEIDNGEPVILLFSELNRIGVECKKITEFLDTAKANHPSIEIISVNHYGFDLYQLAGLISENRCQRSEQSVRIGSSHIDVGSRIRVSEDDEMQQNKVYIRRKELVAEWASLGNRLPAVIKSMIPEAEKIKSEFDRYDVIVTDLIRKGRGRNKKNGDINQYVKDFIKTYPDIQCNFKQTHAIYVRTSRVRSSANQGGNKIECIARDQLAYCLSYAEIDMEPYDDDRFLIINDHGMDRNLNSRPGMIQLLANVLWGCVRHVIMKTTNRFASDMYTWQVLDEVCKVKGAKVYIAKHIGKDYMEMVRMDHERVENNKRRRESLSNAINKMRDELTGDTKQISIDLSLITNGIRQTGKFDDSDSDYSTDSESDESTHDSDAAGDDRKIAHKVQRI